MLINRENFFVVLMKDRFRLEKLNDGHNEINCFSWVFIDNLNCYTNLRSKKI